MTVSKEPDTNAHLRKGFLANADAKANDLPECCNLDRMPVPDDVLQSLGFM